MGENIHLACKWGRNQPVWEFSGWRLFHQVHLIFCWNCEAKYTQDPGRLDLCRWPRYKVVVVVITLLFKIKSRRVVFWNDANGSTFVLSSLGSEELEKHPMIVEDCTVGFSLFFWKNPRKKWKISKKGEGKISKNMTYIQTNIHFTIIYIPLDVIDMNWHLLSKSELSSKTFSGRLRSSHLASLVGWVRKDPFELTRSTVGNHVKVSS